MGLLLCEPICIQVIDKEQRLDCWVTKYNQNRQYISISQQLLQCASENNTQVFLYPPWFNFGQFNLLLSIYPIYIYQLFNLHSEITFSISTLDDFLNNVLSLLKFVVSSYPILLRDMLLVLLMTKIFNFINRKRTKAQSKSC